MRVASYKGLVWEEEGIGRPCSIFTDTESVFSVPSLWNVRLAIIDTLALGTFWSKTKLPML